MSKNPIKVMASILTGRIYAGRVNPKNQIFKKDFLFLFLMLILMCLVGELVCIVFVLIYLFIRKL